MPCMKSVVRAILEDSIRRDIRPEDLSNTNIGKILTFEKFISLNGLPFLFFQLS